MKKGGIVSFFCLLVMPLLGYASDECGFRVVDSGALILPRGLLIRWQLPRDTVTAGYYLDRWDAEGGCYVSAGRGMVMSSLVDEGDVWYSLADEDVQANGVQRYRVRAVQFDGRVIDGAPFDVTPRFPASDIASMAAPAADLPVAVQSAPGAWMKIAVETSGLVCLSSATIASCLNGATEESVIHAIETGLFRMTCGTNEVAWLALPGNTGLCFYAVAQDSIYTRQTIYRLAWGAGVAMQVRSTIPPPGPSTGTVFRDTLHFEQDNPAGYVGNLYSDDPEADIWYWGYLLVPSGGTHRAAFSLDLPHAMPGGEPGWLRATVKGAVANAPTLVNRGRILLNGVTVGQAEWLGTDGATPMVPITNYVAGTNAVVLEGFYQAGDAVGARSYVDSFDISYDRFCRAVSNELLCSAGTNAVVSVDGYTDEGIRVFDVTMPFRPQILDGVMVDSPSPGQWRVTFTPDSPTNRYLAVAGFKAPASVTGRPGTDLGNATNRADYLVVSHASLKEWADRLAQYRASQGFEVMSVDVEDVYDEFSGGVVTPHAIRSLMARARAAWARPPSMAVLIGAGNLDFRNVTGKALNVCLIPCFMGNTPFGLFGVDNPMGDVNGDHVPEVIVGRLPVVDTNEMAGVLEKIRAYEASVTNRRSVSLVADALDKDVGNFAAGSDGLKGSISTAYVCDTNYLTTQPASVVNANWVTAINAGRTLVTYVGHANDYTFGKNKLLGYTDLAKLTNPAPPVLAAMACEVARFDKPSSSVSFSGLAKQMIRKSAGGLTAVWGCTAPGLHDDNMLIGNWLIRALFLRDGVRLGTAMRQAMAAYATEPSAKPWVLDTYGLLGDPALDMRVVGMPPESYEAWKQRVFTAEEQAEPAVSDPDQDPDGDGMDNQAESIAGTGPKDGGSSLKLVEVAQSGGAEARTLRWASVSNRLYQVEFTTNLITSAFMPLDVFLATPPVNSYVDTVDRGSEAVFYRILVLQ